MPLVTRRLYLYFNLCASDVAVPVSAGVVNFLPSSWCSAGVWIWDEKGIDVYPLLSCACTKTRTFQLLALPCQQEDGGQKLGGDTVGTSDPSWPKGCPTL